MAGCMHWSLMAKLMVSESQVRALTAKGPYLSFGSRWIHSLTKHFLSGDYVLPCCQTQELARSQVHWVIHTRLDFMG